MEAITIHLSSNFDDMHLDDIHEMLSKSYWIPGITRNEILKGMQNSALVVGAFIESGRQVGFLRVISDKVRFAYLLDVIVHENYRHRGIGQKMMAYTMEDPDLKDVYHWLLITKDAHGVYAKFGFTALEAPGMYMNIRNPRPDRSDYQG